MADFTVSSDIDTLLLSASNGAARTSLGLGTAATTAATDYATAAQGATADSAQQPPVEGLLSMATRLSWTALQRVQK